MKGAPDIWDKIRRRGTRAYGASLTIYGLQLSPPPPPRIVISAKIDKRSTVRNKIKRRLREIIKKAGVRNLGLVVIVKPGAVEASFRSLHQDFHTTLKKIL